MRTGKNPAKDGLPAYTPHRLGVALIVYIPFTEGYFENSLEIFRYQVDCLRAATSEPFDLLVFDNGSCPQAVSVLRELYAQGQIDWLILSAHNMGKAGAWNWIFASMPNELICYADSDVLFRPGWLAASLQVLEAFPMAGMVGAQPNFYDVMAGEGQAHLALQKDNSYSFSEYWPDKDTIDEYCTGIGANPEIAAQFYSQPLPAITERSSGVHAVIGASHMQFMIPREVARQVVPLPSTRGLLRKETMSIDYKIDSLGYLHLSTPKPHVFHMGNTVSERLRSEVARITGSPESAVPARQKKAAKPSTAQRALTWLAKHPRSNRLLLRAYNLLFRALYTEALEK